MATRGKKRPTSPTKTSSKKKSKYSNFFKKEFETAFPWVKKSLLSRNHAHCRPCNKSFSIASGGSYDIKEHANTASHLKTVAAAFSSKGLGTFGTSTQENSKVTEMELRFAYFFAEHNIAFAAADHLSTLVRNFMSQAAKDPDLATKFSCSRTKTTRLIKDAIAPTLDKEVTTQCTSQPYSILIDESNDRGGEKLLVILSRTFDSKLGRAVTRLVDVPICNISTASSIFDRMTESLRSRGLSYDNLVSFTSDNCNVMMGKNNSVMSRIKEAQPAAYNNGCISHLANLCASDAVRSLPLSPDDLLVDIFYHFQHSSKRKEIYKEYMDFCDVEKTEILRHSTTRWLSLERCIQRVLCHWPSLLAYFQSHDEVEKEGRIKRVAHHLADPLMKLIMFFLKFILRPLNEFNTMFQAESSKMGFILADFRKLLRKFMAKFVKMKVIASANELTSAEYLLDDNLLTGQHLPCCWNGSKGLHCRPGNISSCAEQILQECPSVLRQSCEQDAQEVSL